MSMHNHVPGLVYRSYFFLFTLILVSCHFTSTTIKNPEFRTGMDTITNHLNNLVTCNEISLSGSESKTDGRMNSLLTVTILNGSLLPKDDAGLRHLGKTIATEIKKFLQDQKEYDTIRVSFMTEQKKGAVTDTFTMNFDFKVTEL